MTDQEKQRASEEPTPEGEETTQTAGAEPDNQMERLRADLEAAERQAEENFRHWQRTQADFVNFRRRQEQEQAERVKQAGAAVMRDLLPVLDDLDRAFATVPASLRGLTWVEGLFLIERKLRAILERHGLKPIDALGKPFDPYTHEAVLREDGDVHDQTTVVGELQRGYMLHDRLLRPAMVKVGRAPETATAGSGEQSES